MNPEIASPTDLEIAHQNNIKKNSDWCYSILTVDSHCWWSYATRGKAINCKADIDVTLDQTLTPWRQRLSCSAKRALRETAILCWAPGTVKTHMRRGNECNQCFKYELSNAVQGLPLMQHFRCCWCHPVPGRGQMGWRETLAGLLVQYLYPESSFVGLHTPSVPILEAMLGQKPNSVLARKVWLGQQSLSNKWIHMSHEQIHTEAEAHVLPIPLKSWSP